MFIFSCKTSYVKYIFDDRKPDANYIDNRFIFEDIMYVYVKSNRNANYLKLEELDLVRKRCIFNGVFDYDSKTGLIKSFQMVKDSDYLLTINGVYKVRFNKINQKKYQFCEIKIEENDIINVRYTNIPIRVL
ncbi:MAG: hypothetical protein C4K58_04440 [Flavobacteriaceae bacterium]|nr:MAG: hypothetical protein C4K58_04440 [Flavobacteriaceae bacterium]